MIATVAGSIGALLAAFGTVILLGIAFGLFSLCACIFFPVGLVGRLLGLW